MVTFSLISLAVTAAGAAATWYFATDYMLGQRERSASRQATVNARYVEGSLRAGSDGLAQLVTGLSATSDSAVLVLRDDAWLTSGTGVSPGRIPEGILREVEAGRAATQHAHLNGAPVLIATRPLPSVQASYMEVFPLRELDRSVRFLSLTLIATTIISCLFGAVLGLRASRRALRPLAELNAAVHRVAQGAPDVRFAPTHDPDLAALATAFTATAAELRRREERDARFAGDVSHELRSPLTTMVNAMAVLSRRKADMPPGAGEALELLAGEIHRFEHLVADLLEISRSDHKDDPWEPVDLTELIKHAVPSARQAMGPADDSPGLVIHGDRRRLERVIVNVTDNARRHGGGLVRLAVAGSDEKTVRVEIDDAGPGVPANDRTRVFERFARGAAVCRDTDDSGTGLGLALAAEHIRRHNGRIWVEDRPGGGARFVIELPRAKS
ncbi:hypothetical protein CcI49_28160 [Frankia sp. CcI49]|uniref:sensor histidine kinase n=1 Tax=Frankia sp. CcI49 TaxID=1745382 RepID=UPI0009759A1B|nr:HAMP domain-containing sensor histidine kinase [Frankia sp. CcI49]ONH55410.1 hypothetical protein CcI49_28160 [Frankia sp. CcI49]